jgi:hypothetical protein
MGLAELVCRICHRLVIACLDALVVKSAEMLFLSLSHHSLLQRDSHVGDIFQEKAIAVSSSHQFACHSCLSVISSAGGSLSLNQLARLVSLLDSVSSGGAADFGVLRSGSHHTCHVDSPISRVLLLVVNFYHPPATAPCLSSVEPDYDP